MDRVQWKLPVAGAGVTSADDFRWYDGVLSHQTWTSCHEDLVLDPWDFHGQSWPQQSTYTVIISQIIAAYHITFKYVQVRKQLSNLYDSGLWLLV